MTLLVYWKTLPWLLSLPWRRYFKRCGNFVSDDQWNGRQRLPKENEIKMYLSSCLLNARLSFSLFRLCLWLLLLRAPEETQLMRHLAENVPVQGPEICFPKHASCDFTQHCLAQHQAYAGFWRFHVRKGRAPNPFPSHLAFFRLLFIAPLSAFLSFSPLPSIWIMWTFRALGVWQKILGCWTCAARFVPLFLLKCQHGECVGQSGQACCYWSAFRKSTSCLSWFYSSLQRLQKDVTTDPPCAAEVSSSKCRREYDLMMVMSPTWGFWQKRMVQDEGAWAKRAPTTRNGTQSGSLCYKTCSFISRMSPALDPRDYTCWKDAYATGRLRRNLHSQPRSVWKSRYGELARTHARTHSHTRAPSLSALLFFRLHVKMLRCNTEC